MTSAHSGRCWSGRALSPNISPSAHSSSDSRCTPARRRGAICVTHNGIPRDAVVLITGASSGIGKRLAEDLLRTGATVVAVSEHADRLGAAARDLQAISPKVRPIRCDVGSLADVDRLAAEVLGAV